MSKPQVTIYWMRRDLRLEDNAALFYALKDEFPVQPVFIFDTDILDKLEDKDDARVSFIHQEVGRLSSELREKGCYLDVRYGSPLDVWHRLLEEYDVQRLYANKDYEPYARKRDRAIYDLLESKSIPFIGKKDQVIFEKNEVLKKDGTPYTVYTPYSKVWKEKLSDFYTTSYPSQDIDNWNKGAQPKIISLQEMGFTFPDISTPSRTLNEHIVKKYDTLRNFPAKEGTTQMSVHLRFGTVSIRKLVRRAIALNQKYLNELIWRDFYSSILWHFPKVATDNFHKKYDYIQWRNDEAEFKKWCDGQTGYPIVDAGMRELNATRYMHNRVRMIVASFLTKHLLI
ncbi:MAG: deoxyribodipyrimidine photo-lyase, partial [Cyclobacteriaceae bacterium]|nr:deoxyribodipyrimidine photo-lyase [Cyclobacteriaceae bacterium HetDA_MAG_MS6]